MLAMRKSRPLKKLVIVEKLVPVDLEAEKVEPPLVVEEASSQ